MATNADSASIADSMAATLSRARLRILIVGAGVAGATLAALLRRHGEHPVVIERQPQRPGRGYMLGMLPLGGRVLHAIGMHEAYLECSCPMRDYEFYDRRGRILKRYSLETIVARFGAYRGIERGNLVNLLRQAGDPSAFHYDCEVADLIEKPDQVEVAFSDGSRRSFDLVVGADGLHSNTRSRIVHEGDVTMWRSGWGGWVFWIPPLEEGDAMYRELWSSGWGIGLYPVKDRCGLLVAGRLADLEGVEPDELVPRLRGRLPEGPFRKALERWEGQEGGFFWKVEDCRSRTWHSDRVILLGDAAAGFLPTAGVGASMAMDSAAALADELSRAETTRMGYALSLYERRQRARVERAQSNSRFLARFMFVDSRLGALVRDQMMRFYSVERLISDISRVMEGR